MQMHNANLIVYKNTYCAMRGHVNHCILSQCKCCTLTQPLLYFISDCMRVDRAVIQYIESYSQVYSRDSRLNVTEKCSGIFPGMDCVWCGIYAIQYNNKLIALETCSPRATAQDPSRRREQL